MQEERTLSESLTVLSVDPRGSCSALHRKLQMFREEEFSVVILLTRHTEHQSMSDGQTSPSGSPSDHLGGDPSEQMTLMYLGHLKELRIMCVDHLTDTVFSAHLLFSFSLSSLICFASWHKTSQEVNQMFPEQYRNAGGGHVLCSGVFSMFSSFLSVLPVVFCSVFLPVFSLHCDWLSPS